MQKASLAHFGPILHKTSSAAAAQRLSRTPLTAGERFSRASAEAVLTPAVPGCAPRPTHAEGKPGAFWADSTQDFERCCGSKALADAAHCGRTVFSSVRRSCANTGGPWLCAASNACRRQAWRILGRFYTRLRALLRLKGSRGRRSLRANGFLERPPKLC